MSRVSVVFFAIAASLMFSGVGSAQVDEICAEFGNMPSLNAPSANIPYVFGRVVLKGYDNGSKFPRVTIILADPQQNQKRQTVEKSGNYCFRRTTGSGGTLLVDVDGVEVARRVLTNFGAAQQREDFEIYAVASQKSPPPSVVSTKFLRPPNERTTDLYNKTVESEANKDPGKATGYLKEIVSIDPADFVAWAKLGSLYFEQKALPEAEAAFRKAVELKVEYTPAWISVGQLRVAQKQLEAAIEIFKHATLLDPTSARAFQLLGEAYLQTRQGTLGSEALNEAIRLDPKGMAECHLQLAHLYELAGAKKLATQEYKLFLAKVPDHPDKKKFEKYVKNNPE